MLITLEGLDGCGKSTACRALDDAFSDAVLTREPTDSWYGEAVRQSVSRDGADPLAELFLYTADHAAHLHRIVRPALASDQLVISDRYADSRYAYQGATLADRFDDPIGFVRSIHEPWTHTPDHTIFLEVPPAVGAARSGSTNKFERESFLERVDANYRRLIEAEPERFTVIDADRAEATVRDAVVATVETLVDKNS